MVNKNDIMSLKRQILIITLGILFFSNLLFVLTSNSIGQISWESNIEVNGENGSISDETLQERSFEVDKIIMSLPSFSDDEIQKDDKAFSEWSLSSIPGAPQLPVQYFQILLPPNVDSDTVSIEVIEEKTVQLEGSFYCTPAPFPVALLEDEIYISNEDDSSYVYANDEMWPNNIVNSLKTSRLREANLLEFSYYPLQFNPVKNTVYEHENVKISINWEKTEKKDLDPLTYDFLTKLGSNIDNLEELLPLYKPKFSEIPDHTYVIITTNDIQSNSSKLDDFVRYKQALGFNVCIITENDFGIAEGKQRALNMRTWLQNHYVTDSIEYVLLVGNPNPDDETIADDPFGDIPMLMCWPRYPAPDYRNSPTDYFYADLTGNWDSDGDGYYGEHADDSGVDFYPEVFVGRIPVYNEDYTTLDNILERVMNHHIVAGDEKNNILEAIAISNYAEEDGDDKLLRSDGLNCPQDFYNYILLSSGMEDTVMYERSGIDPVPVTAFHYDLPLTDNNFITEFNKGQGAVFWWGHGSDEGVFRKYWENDVDGSIGGIPEAEEMAWETFMHSDNMSLLETDQPSFIYQSSCYNGYPENPNNLGYAMLKRGAAISTVSASRVSWYLIGTWGHSTYWSFYADNTGIGFYYMENLLENKLSAGKALFMAKMSGGDGTYSGSWMNKMDFNLYGDPQLNYWGSEQPDEITIHSPADLQKGVDINCTLSVYVSDPDDDSLSIAFYNATDDSLIGIDLDVESTETASVVWSGLVMNKTYSWYVIVGDGQVIRESDTWTFTTNNSPPEPKNPSPADQLVNVHLPVVLSVDVYDADGDTLDVWFYNASDDSLIAIELDLSSNDTSLVMWSGLAENETYSWYTIVTDGVNTTKSQTWTFTTEVTTPEWDETPTNQVFTAGIDFVYDVNASDISGISTWWINDTVNFNIDSEGRISNAKTLEAGEYWIEIRAYDPYGYNCSATINITLIEVVSEFSANIKLLILVTAITGVTMVIFRNKSYKIKR